LFIGGFFERKIRKRCFKMSRSSEIKYITEYYNNYDEGGRVAVKEPIV